MFKTIGTVAAFALLTSATWFSLGVDSTANAWRTDYDAKAYCSDNHSFSFDWRFENTEPNEDKYTMDVTVTEVISGQSVTETVAPGEEISGTFDTDYTSINSWRIKFDTTWTDGRSGSHQFGEAMPGWECQQPEEPKQIEVCRDGVVITINEEDRRDSDTNPPCPTPEEPKQVEVCRDGEVITIDEDDRLDSDTDAPCPVPEEKTVDICRDGKEMTVLESEVLDSDLEGDCPEVLGETTLPNTGASALISVGLGATTLLSAGYGAYKSRR